ncbi:hypothetical protein [Bacterioplanoides sp.]|uniref:hypothetical protein n=1 Tax=Bacterioplanoides sp. TaxID=2066072 RepID=UPI003B5A5709
MRVSLFRCCVIALTLLLPATSQAIHWQHSQPQPHGKSYYGYLSGLGVENVFYNSKCSSDNACSYWIRIGERKLSLGKDSSLIGHGRYLSGSYAFYKSGEQYYVAASHGRPRKLGDSLSKLCGFGLLPEVIVSPRGEVVCHNNEKLFINGKSQPLPQSAIYASFGVSYKGHWALAFIDEDYNLHVGNQQGFRQIRTGLHGRSDLKDILSVFPTGTNSAWVAVYEYRSKRNKSLMLYRLSEQQQRGYQVLNSIVDDAGINPQLYLTRDNQIRLHSNALRQDYYYQFSPASLSKQQPLHNPFPEPDLAEFSLSLGTRLTAWSVDQEVKEPKSIDDEGDGKTLAKTRYNMNNSLLTEVRFSGRILNTQLALSYLESKAEEGASQLEKAASRKLFGTLGFDQFFSGASSLVIEYAKEDVGGIATFRSGDSPSESTAFTNRYERYALLKTEEKGIYKGVSYSRNNVPTAIAFFESGLRQPKIYFDRDFELEKLLFVIGYNTAQYTARYMFNHSSFYLNGRVGAGLFSFRIGDRVVREAEQHFGKSYEEEISLALDANIEFGYLWQNRSLKHAGLGSTVQLGFSTDVEFYINTVDKETTVDSDEIITSFERTDWRYGPFLRASLIF